MATESYRQELLNALKAERARWEALLTEVGAERTELPGVVGEWAVKDIVAHLSAWAGRAVAWLDAARQGTSPQPPPWPANPDEDQINAWIFKSNRDRPLLSVLAESRQVFDQLANGISSVSEEELTATNRPWLGAGSLNESIPGNSYEHLSEHAEAIRAWLNKQQNERMSGGALSGST